MSGQPIIRSDDLRAENRHRILRTLRREGPQTRAVVGELTGLSAASVSVLIASLSDQGIVVSSPLSGARHNRRGRPQASISLQGAAAVTATVSLTIDRLRINLVNYSGHTLLEADNRLDTRVLTGAQLIAAVGDEISRALTRHPGNTLRHISIGFQGVTDNLSGDLMWSPILGVNHVPIRDALRQRFEVDISVNNDCRVIAEALHHSHHTELGRSFITVLFAHGIGMGLYLDGRPFSGTRSSGLEFGHLLHEREGAICRCGRRGCIEAYASDYAIERCSRAEAETTVPSGRVSGRRMQSIIAAARGGDTAAQRAFTAAGAAIGQGLGNIFTLLDPMPVALVGRSTGAFDLMAPSLSRALENSNGWQGDLDHLIHCFRDEHPLLDTGLALVALSRIDRQFADMNAAAATYAQTRAQTATQAG